MVVAGAARPARTVGGPSQMRVASSPPREAARDGVEDELVDEHHHDDHHERPHEDHLRREDLAAVVHDVADARGHAEDLGDDGHLEREPEPALHARHEVGDRRGHDDGHELLAAREAIDVAHLQQAPVDVLDALDDVRGDEGERDHERGEDRRPVREAEPDDRDHDPHEDGRGVQDGEGVVDDATREAREEAGQSHEQRHGQRGTEAHEDAVERGARVRPHLAGPDDLDEPGDDREGRGQHVGSIPPGEQRPGAEHDEERREGGEGEGVRAVPLSPHARWKNSLRIRSGSSQSGDLRNPNSLLILSWTIRVSTCSSGSPWSMRTVSLYATWMTSRGSLVTSPTISMARSGLLYQMSTASFWASLGARAIAGGRARNPLG